VTIDIAGHGHEIKPGSNRSFGLVFAGFFTLVGTYGVLQGSANSWASLVIAGLFAGIAMAAPAWLAPLNRLWFRLGMLLARIIQPLVVGLVFFFVVTPIALIMRATGKDFLRLKLDPAARTYWIERPPMPRAISETMKRQF
jgi:hypothetical protein